MRRGEPVHWPTPQEQADQLAVARQRLDKALADTAQLDAAVTTHRDRLRVLRRSRRVARRELHAAWAALDPSTTWRNL